MNRYPTNTIVTIEDFRKSDWASAVSSIPNGGYYELWQSFSKLAATAIETEKFSEGKVLWLIADACSMALRPEKINEPYQAFMEIAGRRSVLLEDFHDEDIELFGQISEEIDNVWLKARLSDLVWLWKTTRSFPHALMAIDAYRIIPLDLETWLSGGRECWERAITLAKMLNKGAGGRAKAMEISIIEAFQKTKIEDGFFALWLSDLLLSHEFGKDNSVEIAEKLALFAHEFAQNSEYHRSIEYYATSAKWFKRSKHEKYIEMTIQVAEGWVKEAETRIGSGKQGYSTALSFYEKAIQIYRSIPRNERIKHNINDRIDEVHRSLSMSGEKSLGEMVMISSPLFDITKYVEYAQTQIKGKNLIDAFCAFTSITQGSRVSELRESAERTLREHPLKFLFPATHISRDGRVIAKQSGSSLGDVNSESYKAMVWEEMVSKYSLEIIMRVTAEIVPAMGVLVLEHRLREIDFISIANQSPIVPVGRDRLWAKALFMGYDQDFISALHLLVPQIENMVRWHLKERDIKTTNLDQYGIENENGLSSLIDIPEAKHIFGEDIVFEIKALFCDSIGPNLRNEVAHGLSDENACHSAYSIYAWWLGLKLVFNTYWNALPKSNQV